MAANPTHFEFVELLKKYYPRNWKYWPENDIGYDQVPTTFGKKQINKLALSVTPAQGVGKWAKQNGCDCVLVHHPYGTTAPIPSYSCHTRADRGLIDFGLGTKVGINELWAKYLGLKNVRQVDDLYAWGEFEKPITFEEADRRVARVIQHVADKLGDKINYDTCKGEKFTVNNGALIKSVNICCGMGGLVLGNRVGEHRADKKEGHKDYADLYVTGQLTSIVTENNQNFKHILECGHTLHERLALLAWKIILKTIFPKLRIVIVPAGIDFWSGDPRVDNGILK